MSKLSDKVRALKRRSFHREDWQPADQALCTTILADVESLEADYEAVMAKFLTMRDVADEFEGQLESQRFLSQRVASLEFLAEQQTLGHAEVVRLAKIEAYEDARRLCWLRDYGHLPRAGDDIADDLAAAIDALKAGDK